VSNETVEMGTKDTAQVVGRGTVILKLQCGSSFETRKLENVLHVPDFEYSLWSVSAMDKKDSTATFENGKVILQTGKVIVATAISKGSLHEIEAKPLKHPPENALLASLQLWHERLAHVDNRDIARMAKRGRGW